MSRVNTYVTRVEAVKYTGSNGANIIDILTDLSARYADNMGWSITSATESAGVITVTADNPFNSFTLSVGQWLVFVPFNLFVVPTDDVFHAYYRTVVPQVGTSLGVRGVPGPIALNGSVQLDVQLSRPFDTTDFTPLASLVGAAAGLVRGAVTIIDVNTVRVTVTASVAYAGGAQLLVVAHGIPANP